jgi:hypothetical protein
MNNKSNLNGIKSKMILSLVCDNENDDIYDSVYVSIPVINYVKPISYISNINNYDIPKIISNTIADINDIYDCHLDKSDFDVYIGKVMKHNE